MKERTEVLLLGVGGGAGQIVDRIAKLAGQGLRTIVMDTDAVAMSGVESAETRLLGAVRLEGVGAGGDPVNGRLAAQDDVSIIRETLAGFRFMVLVTTLGGGTGGGASPEILAYARQSGVATLCFSLLPFEFEGRRRMGAAERVIPLLEDASDALVVLENEALYSKGREVPLDEALRRAALGLESGVLMLWRMLAFPGFIRLDERAIRGLLAHGGGSCRYAFASAGGDGRAREIVERLLASPGLRGGKAMTNAGAVLVCIQGGDDLRLIEISEIMKAIETQTGAECRVRLGTVRSGEGNGLLDVALLVFENWHAEDAAPVLTDPAARVVRGNRRKTDSKLSFGATGRGRFHDIEPTVFEGEDMDVPAYTRRGIVLEP